MGTTINGRAVNSQGASRKDLNDGELEGSGAPAEPQIKQAPVKQEKPSEEVKTQEKPVEEVVPSNEAANLKPVEEAKQVPEQTTDAQNTWPTYQDDSLNAASNVLKESGVTPKDAGAYFSKALESGKLEDIDVKGLEEKLGKDKAILVMAGVRDYYTRQSTKTKETINQVHSVFGSEAGYNKVRDWATEKAKADPNFAADLGKYRDMFNQGGVSARAAALDMLRSYNADPKTSGVQNKMTEGQNIQAKSAESTPLSRADYLAECKKANKINDRDVRQATMKRLDQQRLAGIKAKI